MITSTKPRQPDHADIDLSLATILWLVVAILTVIFSIVLFSSDQFFFAVSLALIAYLPAQKSYESYKIERRRHETRQILDLRELTYSPALSSGQTCQVIIAFEYERPTAYASTRIHNALQTALNRTFSQRTKPPAYEELEELLHPDVIAVENELPLSYWQYQVKYIQPIVEPAKPEEPQGKRIWT